MRGIEGESRAVLAYGFDGTAFHGLDALSGFFGRGRLFEDVRITSIFLTLKIFGRALAAQVAIDALLIHVKRACDIFRMFVVFVRHVVFL